MATLAFATWAQVLLFFITVYCVYQAYRRLKFTRLPGPWGLPIVGYLPFLKMDAPYESLTHLAKIYGGAYELSLGSINTVVLSDAKKIRHALKQEAFNGRPPLYITNGIMGGYGIISAEGELWKEQRKFSVACLRDLGAVRLASNKNGAEDAIRQEANDLIQEILKTNGEAINVHHLIRNSISHVTASVIFGEDFDDDKQEFLHQLDLIDAGSQYVQVIGALNFLPFLRHLPWFGKLMKDVLKSKADHHNYLRGIVERRRGKLLAQFHPDAKCLLDAYIIEIDHRQKTGNVSSFTETQLLHLLADFFGAGVDTVKVTLKWAILFLMHQPEVQMLCQQELDLILGPSDLPTLCQLESCPYTNALILEVQRLANVVPLGAPHGTTEDADLDGCHIPKGSMVIPLLWAIHRDPVIWHDPTTFDPQRFLDPEGNVHKPDYLMPFSTGRRSCAGEGMAKATLSLYLASILHKFNLQPEEGSQATDLTPIPGFILSPKPFKVCLVPRFNE